MTKYQKVDEFNTLIESPVFINQLEDSIKELDLATLTDLYNNLPKTYQKVLIRLAKTMTKQYHKGIIKYGVSIDDAKDEDYNWHEMALEEIADMFVYLERARNQK